MTFIICSPKYGDKIVEIDDEDYAIYSKYTWRLNKRNNKFYVVTTILKPRKDFKLHRLIMGILNNPQIHIDHKNGNTLDNKKENLRVASIAENTRNTGVTTRNTTGYKGIFLYKNKGLSKPYTASIRFEGKKIFGGYFETAKEAAIKYNEMAKQYHGEFAYLNIINDDSR